MDLAARIVGRKLMCPFLNRSFHRSTGSCSKPTLVNTLPRRRIVTGRQLRYLASFVFFSFACFRRGLRQEETAPPPEPPPPPVVAPAPTAEITATPSVVTAGDKVVIAWRTTNASTVSIDGIGTVSAEGTQTVNPPTPPTITWWPGAADRGCNGARNRQYAAAAAARVPLVRHDRRSDLPPERCGYLLRLRQLRFPQRRPGHHFKECELLRGASNGQGRTSADIATSVAQLNTTWLLAKIAPMPPSRRW